MKQLTWFLQELLLPFVLGIVFCVSLTVLFSIFNTSYLLGWASEELLPFSLPRALLLRPISDLLPFALLFIVLYHLYNFAKDRGVRKEALEQFVVGIFAYLLLTIIVGPLAALCLCVLFPFVFTYIRDKRLKLHTNFICILTSPFQLIGWMPGCLFGLGLSQGFLIALPYSLLLLGAPYITVYILCLYDKEL